MQIETLDTIDDEAARRIRAFLSSAPAGSGVCAEHDPGWLHVLHESMGHRPIALTVAADNASKELVGYLPLALVRSRLFGRFLVSLPYLNRAGIVALDDAVAEALVERAVELADEHDVDYLELRHQTAVEHAALPVRRDEKVRMVLDLPESSEAVMGMHKSKLRSQVKKANEHGLSLKWGGRDLLDDFYGVFAVNMRDLGTPVYPKALFGSILDTFPADADGSPVAPLAELCVVYQGEQAIAGALLLHDPAGEGVTQVPSASTLRDFNHTNANMWMYHYLLERAAERGSRKFDYGRSSVDSGTYRFKKQWGSAEYPTVWQYHVRRGDVSRMRPDNAKNQRRIALWKRLPVWVTRLVGPRIVRGIP